MTPMKPGLAKRALEENLARFVNTKTDPMQHNLHVALIQIAQYVEAVHREQQDQRQLLEQILAAARR